MRKYWTFYKISLQDTLNYRGPMVVWLLGNIVSLMVIVSLWLSADKTIIGGYTKPELISYYLISLAYQWLIGWFPYYWVRDEIADGTIVAANLIKPVSLFQRAFAREFGWHSVSVFIGIASTIIVAIFLQGRFIIQTNSGALILFAISTVFTILITFTFSLCMGMIAFWTIRTGPLDNFFWAGRFLLGGQMIPVSFIGGALSQIVFLSPFRYIFSFPLEIYFRKLSTTQIINGFLMQIFWFGIFYLIYLTFWKKGTKNYVGFGQ